MIRFDSIQLSSIGFPQTSTPLIINSHIFTFRVLLIHGAELGSQKAGTKITHALNMNLIFSLQIYKQQETHTVIFYNLETNQQHSYVIKLNHCDHRLQRALKSFIHFTPQQLANDYSVPLYLYIYSLPLSLTPP